MGNQLERIAGGVGRHDWRCGLRGGSTRGHAASSDEADRVGRWRCRRGRGWNRRRRAVVSATRGQEFLRCGWQPAAATAEAWGAIRSYDARESAWAAGLSAFAERPLLGWGAENFIAAFGRHATGAPTEGHVHDRAHNELIEKAVAEGLPGLAAHLMLWALALCAVVRAAKAQTAKDQAVTLAVGAALAGHFLANQWQFDSTALKMQITLLFAYAVGLEMSVAGKRPRLPGVRRVCRSRHGKALMAIFGVSGVALAASGLASNRAIHAAATAFLDMQPAQRGYIERTIAAFPPLAAEPQRRLFNHVASEWEGAYAQDETRAKQLLAKADAQARAITAEEPDDWRLHRAAARMYLAVATTDPLYRTAAAHHIERAQVLAPKL